MTFSIITPSFRQLDWLRLCVASVRDQVEEKSENLKIQNSEIEAGTSFANSTNKTVGLEKTDFSVFAFQRFSISVEHLIQDAGTPGIEDFAREIGADFYRNGELVFSSSEDRRSEIGDREAEIGDLDSSHSPSMLDPQPSTPTRPPSTLDSQPSTRPYHIAIYCERDAGMYDAINRGLSRASGELCAYLNCDEQYLPGTLQRVADWFFANPKKEVLFADAVLLGEDGRALSYRRTVLPDRLHTRLCHLNTLTCSTFFRRKVFAKGHRFPVDKKVIGDGVWVVGMLAAKVPMGYLREPTSAFTFTGANLSELDQGATSEQALWGREPGAPPRWLKLPVMVLHRLQKLLAGAYTKRNLEISIFRPGDSAARHTFRACNLGSSWPKASPDSSFQK